MSRPRALAAWLALLPLAALGAADYAAWAGKNADGAWTAAAEQAVAASALPASLPGDVQTFCPAYAERTPEERVRFWAGLLSSMARPESNFKPEAQYVEAFADAQGHRVVSRGLLQISIESANQARYGCAIAQAEDLHDPAVNLACGVKILAYWVATDGVIASYGTGPSRGGGRYWSTLRERNKHLPELTGFTRQLAVCQPR
jgi:hypothetical protein